MADYAWRQRLGRADARRPASSDWREYLHHEGREDDRKKLPQPPTHESSHLLTKKLIMRADGCRAGTTRPYFAIGNARHEPQDQFKVEIPGGEIPIISKIARNLNNRC